MIDATFKHKEDEDGSTALLIPGYKKLDRDQVKWCKPQDDDHEERIGIAINRDDLKQWVRFVIQNTRCELGGEVFHLVHGIPIGTNCGRECINGYLNMRELGFTRRLCEARRTIDEPISDALLVMIFGKRYADDVWLIQLVDFDSATLLYDERDTGGTDGIYPARLVGPRGEFIEGPLNLKLQDAGTKVPYLDTQLQFDPDTRLLSWNHYDKRDHIEAFIGTHTFPHPRSRLHRRCKVGTYTGFLHRINRATTSNSGFVRKAVKQGRAMIAHGYKRRDICDRVRAFSAFDERKGWWPAVQGRILKRLSL